jgi:hypothetical protein
VVTTAQCAAALLLAVPLLLLGHHQAHLGEVCSCRAQPHMHHADPQQNTTGNACLQHRSQDTDPKQSGSHHDSWDPGRRPSVHYWSLVISSQPEAEQRLTALNKKVAIPPYHRDPLALLGVTGTATNSERFRPEQNRFIQSIHARPNRLQVADGTSNAATVQYRQQSKTGSTLGAICEYLVCKGRECSSVLAIALI